MHSGERRSLNFDPELSLLHKMVTSSFIIGSKFPSTGHCVHKIHNLKMPFWLTISSFSFKSIGLVFAWLGWVHCSSKLVWFDIHQSNRNQILKLAFLHIFRHLLSLVDFFPSKQQDKLETRKGVLSISLLEKLSFAKVEVDKEEGMNECLSSS